MPQRILIRTLLTLATFLFAFHGVSHGQTRSQTPYSVPITLGWEGAVGASNQRVVVISNIPRKSSQISWLVQDPQTNSLVVHMKGSDGFELDTAGGTDSEPDFRSDTKTLSRKSALVTGTITFQSTETFSSRYNRYIPDVAVQVVAQTLNAQGNVISSSASVPSNDTASADTSFFAYAQLGTHVQTGLTLTNNTGQSATVTLALYDLFSHALPYASVSKTIPAGQNITGTLDTFFTSLSANDGGGSKLTDANVDISSDQLLTATAFRVDDGVRSDMPVFLGRATGPLPNNNSPALLLEQGTDLAAAVDAQTHVRDPFSIMTTPWFGGDAHTRILLFVQNVQLANGESLSAIQVLANGTNLPVEDIRPVPNFPWSQLMIRLPDGLPSGTLSVTVTFHSLTSNAGKLRIK